MRSIAKNFRGNRAADRRLTGGRAFTLLELVVAMAMVAVLALSLYASMKIAFRAKAVAETAVEPSRTAELAMELIREDVENALAPSPASINAIVQSFEGTQGTDDRGREADDLVFYSTADAPQHIDANGDVKMIELAVETPQGSRDHVLVRRVTRNLLAEEQAQPDEEVICRGVSSFSMEYFDGTEWQTTWDSTQQNNTLPTAVMVVLALDRPAGAPDAKTLRFTRVFPMSCSTTIPTPENDLTGG
jgi:type II secretion system protein J